MTRRADGGPAPLSHAQHRLWFLDRLQPGVPVYNLPVLFAVAGPLAAAPLAAALAEIVRRHDVLRTAFTVDRESGDPLQVVAAPAGWRLPLVDLTGLPAAPRAAEADLLLAAERRVPFDLAHGPLLRSLLVRLGPEEHRLALTLHHIVADGWSVGVLRRELQALYGAATAGRPSPLPELPVQYADFSVWQRHWLARGEWESQLSWWRQTLSGIPPTLDLPADRPRPPVRSLRGGQATLPLGAELAAEVAGLGWQRGTTLFMTLLAAFAALLYRYTGQEDLWLGTPIANRRHAETENLVGLFVNSLVLRVDLGGDPTFEELLGRVRETALAAYDHQDLPFEKLVEELAPARDLSRTPLFQVLFAADAADNGRAAPAELAPGVTLEALAVEIGAAKLDLALSVGSAAGGLEATVEWATDLFDETTVQRLLAHFRRLLESAAGNPEARIGELPMLAGGEREEIVAAGRRPPAMPATPRPGPRRAGRDFIAPRTPLEEEVAAIWRAVLKVDRVGIDDSFWDLGGHSLIATKVLARVRDGFGVDLPLQTLFATPRLAEFADAVGQSVLAAQGADIASLLAELDGLSDEEIRAFLTAEERVSPFGNRKSL